MALDDLSRTRAAIVGAAFAGFIELCASLWLVAQDEPRLFISPGEMAAGAIISFLCAWGLTRRSRTAVILLCLSFFLYIVQSLALWWGWWLTIGSSGLFLISAQAVPPVWRLQRKQPPTRSAFLSAAGAVTGFATVGAAVWFAHDIALTPPTRVLPAAQLPSIYQARFREIGAVDEETERILYYSSTALGRFDSEFYLLTDAHVVGYSEAWIEPLIRIPLEEIVDVDTSYSDSWMFDSFVHVVADSGIELVIPLSSEAGGDARFASELRRQWVKNGGSLARPKRDESESPEDDMF